MMLMKILVRTKKFLISNDSTKSKKHDHPRKLVFGKMKDETVLLLKNLVDQSQICISFC